MPRIGEYTEAGAPNKESEIVHSLDGITRKTRLKYVPFMVFAGKMRPLQCDMQGGGSSQHAPFTITAINGGTMAQIASTADHPGIWRVTSAAGANSGYSVVSFNSSVILIGGGEIAEFIVRFPSVTSLTARAGFYDENTMTVPPTDGAWIEVNGATLVGKTANNGAVSTTGSSYAVAANTWYRLKVEVNEDATLVDFYIYDENGAELWNDSLATNIPTAAGRETDFRCGAIKTAVTATGMMDVDWLAFYRLDPQTR